MTELIFSVMISSSGFYCSTVPSSATSQRLTVPFFIAIPSLGMRTSVGMARQRVARTASATLAALGT